MAIAASSIDLDSTARNFLIPGQLFKSSRRRSCDHRPARSPSISAYLGISIMASLRKKSFIDYFDFPLALGVLLTAGFYLLIYLSRRSSARSSHHYTTEHVVEYVVVFFFIWGIVDVVLRACRSPSNRSPCGKIGCRRAPRANPSPNRPSYSPCCRSSPTGRANPGSPSGFIKHCRICRKKALPTASTNICNIWPRRMKNTRTPITA